MTEAGIRRLTPELRVKLDACRRILHDAGRVAVALSGGVDSALLLAMAAEAIGRDDVLAIMCVSPIFPQRESLRGREIARRIGVEFVELTTPQLADPSFTANPADRCFHCKSLMLSRLKACASERGFPVVATGANADDRRDYRPGARAEEEHGALRPLLDAEMTKDDIRAASRAMGLETWDMPPAACLASRIPYGQAITVEKLGRIEKAEEILRDLGFNVCRVRDHGQVARIEVAQAEIPRVSAEKLRRTIFEAFKELGYIYVTIDLEGFRSGSMNEIFNREP